MHVTTSNIPIEHELKLTPATNVQVKLLASLRTQTADQIIQTLKGTLGVGDFVVTIENIKSIIDDYYDTDDLTLYQIHSVFRVRREGDRATVVIKELAGQTPGELKRTEYELPLSEPELQSNLAQDFASIVASQLPDLRDKKLKYKLKISNERHNYLMERQGERYRLSLDIFTFTNPKTGRGSDAQYEVEIEALNEAASAKLGRIKHHLLDVLTGFRFSPGSKYERGIKVFYIDAAQWRQALAAWNSGPGLGWVGAIIGLAGLIVGIIGTWAALR